MVVNADGAGEGFNDPTPRAPVGGNTGKTLGAQRLIAVQHAADLWGAVLDSNVPIVVRATFDPLGCAGALTELAHAAASGVNTGIAGDGGNPALVYPRALAERLAGVDLDSGGADIDAVFNSSADDPSCMNGDVSFYYGLDGQPGVSSDVVTTALHELGHGLGVSDFVDRATGDWLGGSADAYSTHVLDLTAGKHWDALTSAERLASLSNVRKVVWDGTRVTAVARDFLAHGLPKLTTTPALSAFSGVISDADFGTQSSATAAFDAPLLLGNPIDGSNITPGAARKVVLLEPAFQPSSVAQVMEQLGSVGVLMAVGGGWDSPPLPLDEPAPLAVGIPVLSLTSQDSNALKSALASGAVTVQLTVDRNAVLGSDAQGRVFLDATKPPSDSSISHWDTLPRPNLLMEPILSPGQPNDVDLTQPMLYDLGWTPFCGNARLDQQEACDDGSRNSDSRANACRSDCRKAHCGDAVVDRGEACDLGASNSDTTADACRSDCTQPRCGDGTKDHGEACDLGPANSDTMPDACRSDCTRAHCGDGVQDRGESCDDGSANSDTEPGACRSDCSKAHCGDGVKDPRESCDDGSANSDTTPDACRKNCMPASCGDGTMDQGEQCDEGSANSDTEPDSCRKDCTPPRCGDGVTDRGESCDDGDGPCAKRGCKTGNGGGGDAGTQKGSTQTSAKHGGCGCNVPGAARGSTALGWLLPAWLTRRRLRRAAARPDRA
jgi:hypothetical protein